MKEFFGKPINKLGFGFMRLPVLGRDDRAPVDIEQVKQMVDYFLENGYTYFDTAYNYHGGMSEVAFREAVVERYPRDAFQLTTKLPLRRPMDKTQMRAMTNESLSRTGLEYFDLYFLHGINAGSLPVIDSSKGWEYMFDLKKEGITKNFGFSYHGDAEGLKQILGRFEPGEIDIVQLQINYLDWDSPSVQSRLCYEAVRDYGAGIIIMEPIKGGSLANFDGEVAEIFKAADPEASFASWALRFCYSLEGVVSVLSGMSTLDQVVDNVATANNFKPLTEADMGVIKEAMAALERVPLIQCTECRYCVDDCPEHINTPGILSLMNEYTKYRNLSGARRSYGFAIGAGFGDSAPAGKASDCTECRNCEKICPQELPITDYLKEAAALFE